MNLRALSILFFLSIASLSTVAQADLRIVATTPDLAALAREIGGEHVRVSALALPTQDPHFVDARPNLALDLARADMLLLVGLDLEVGWLGTLLTGSRNRNIQRGAQGYVDCSQFVEVLEAPTQRVDRSMGDVHPGGNPHYLWDPRRAVEVARGIAGRMGALDHAHESEFQRNLQTLLSSIATAQRDGEQRLAGLRGAKVVTYHRSFSYLANWLGFSVVAEIEPRPGIPPDPRHVASIMGTIRRDHVRMILQEGWCPSTTSGTLAERTGATLVVLTGGPDFRAGQSYRDFVGAVVAAIARGASL